MTIDIDGEDSDVIVRRRRVRGSKMEQASGVVDLGPQTEKRPRFDADAQEECSDGSDRSNKPSRGGGVNQVVHRRKQKSGARNTITANPTGRKTADVKGQGTAPRI